MLFPSPFEKSIDDRFEEKFSPDILIKLIVRWRVSKLERRDSIETILQLYQKFEYYYQTRNTKKRFINRKNSPRIVFHSKKQREEIIALKSIKILTKLVKKKKKTKLTGDSGKNPEFPTFFSKTSAESARFWPEMSRGLHKKYIEKISKKWKDFRTKVSKES